MPFVGSIMCGRKRQVKSWGFCEKCGNYQTLSSYRTREWMFFCFLPVFPCGLRLRIIKECGSCGVGIRLPEREVAGTVKNIRKDIEQALEALKAGKSYFVLAGKEGREAAIPCLNTLVEAADILHCLGKNKIVNELYAGLEEARLDKESSLLKGKLFEFDNELESASAEYQGVISEYPGDENAYWFLGRTLTARGMYPEARGVYEKLLRVSDDECAVMFRLIDIYGELEDYAAQAETFASCLAKSPELVKDEDFVNSCREACENAGVKPRFQLP